MWHEARKQERMIRGLIVDYRRRAERRKDFYEKIKAEPTQFLQLHGRPCKIHLDPAIAAAGESSAIMMPWQGDPNNMIDRFDVRAHLDYIPEVKYPDIPPEDLDPEERQCNYERYRILAQNMFLGISEDKFLQQLAIEEQFGVTIEEKEMQKEKLNEKKGTGAAIGYNYSDPGAQPSSSNGPEVKKMEQKDSDDDSDLEIIDVDLSIDVNKMEASQAHELNAVGPHWGMAGCDLFSFLTGDADDAEHQKQLLREEKEKAMFSGRKSRRERRAHRDKKLQSRVVSPPSYAAPRARSPSPSPRRSRSASPPAPPAPDTIQFITCFGGDDDEQQPPKPLYADKLKFNLKKEPLYSEVARKPKTRSPQRPPMGPYGPPPKSRSRSISRSRSRSQSRSRSLSKSRSRSRSRSRSHSRSRSRSRSYRKSYSRSSSRSRSRSRSRLRSRSRSRSRGRDRGYRRRSRSPINHGYSKRNNSRSMSYESSCAGPARAPAAPRYYGRRAEDKSSSELELDSDSDTPPAPPAPPTISGDGHKTAVGNKSYSNQNQLRSGASSKGPSRETLSLKEKLRRKMQAQLSRQLRADKRQEAERLARERGRQARRDEEMRELAIKLRRKQREMRHQQNRRSSDSDSDGSHSRSSSRDSNPDRKKERSRSKSPTPEKRIPVWETNRDFATVPYRRPTDANEQYRRRFDDDRPQYNRLDRPREYRHDAESRWEHDRPDRGYGRRRPFRGGYRGQDANDQYRRRFDDDKPHHNRLDRPREYRHDAESRWEHDRPDRGYGRRRPFRGGYRGQDANDQYRRRFDDDKPHHNRLDRPREYRHDAESRWEHDRPDRGYGRRRPFRGGYRGQDANDQYRRRFDDDKPHHNRLDRPREYRHDAESRWEHDRPDRGYGRRRTFRGGYRGQGFRHGGDHNSYGDGPSSYQQDDRDDRDDKDDYPRNKVKLVDY